VASGGVEQANGLFVRVYETLTMHAHERAANSFLRAQAIVRRADNGASTAFVKQPAQRSKTHAHVKARSHARASTPRRHQATAPARASASLGAATTSRAGSSPAPATAARASAASAGSPRRAATSASSEFGFEGP